MIIAFNTPLEMPKQRHSPEKPYFHTLSILHWRCEVEVNGTTTTTTRTPFNTPLEMPGIRHGVPYSTPPADFQYSIGDAVEVVRRDLSRPYMRNFQYSIGDAEVQYGGV